MAEGQHTYGPTCAYHEDDDAILLPHESSAPPLKSQFFYVSSLPIDDPLSPLPPIQVDRSSKQPPQPFSTRDNAALEEAWQGFRSAQQPGKLSRVKPSLKGILSFPKFKEGVKSPAVLSPAAERTVELLSKDQQRATEMLGEYNKLPRPPVGVSEASKSKTAVEKPSKQREAIKDPTRTVPDGATTAKSEQEPSSHSRETSAELGQLGGTESQVMLTQSPASNKAQASPVDAEELRHEEAKFNSLPTPKHKSRQHLSPFRRRSKGQLDSDAVSKDFATVVPNNSDQPQAQAISSDISGRPFARAPSKRNITGLAIDGPADVTLHDEFDSGGDRSRSRSRDRAKKSKKPSGDDKGKVFVPVGVARLHLVELPDLVMQPIYWSPINDTSDVIRATWFYKDTMLPLPAEVANRLEIGYEYIKPYSESYQDELQMCIENGASAELKLVHRLWPQETKSSRPGTSDMKFEEESQEDHNSSVPNEQSNVAVDSTKHGKKRVFQTHSVIYADRKNAQILKPSLLPSVRQNRRPLSSIRKGRHIGVAVVRGFDRNAWQKLYPPNKMTARAAHARVGAYMSQSGDATTRGRRMSCAACENDSRTPRVSDLVLVVHGIGQKLSERVDSYHFTHAINGLRREFNVELSSESVKGNLNADAGIMILPVNWRLTVSFDEASTPSANGGRQYKLEDITPDTLPAVRSVISDVMLDIPYYLSHHKDKMTSAVIREANRVFRLWCRNNPGFQEHGRVHVVAHSLGAVMAMEILSKQPTTVPQNLRLDNSTPSSKMLEFNTTNLFCCGSPAGFFLLLNNARLIPRKGRDKPGMEGEDHTAGVAAEEGYGCLAVDNLYNICHRNDPIAYFINAAVDPDYAASLEPAYIPSAATSIFSRLWSSSSSSDAYGTKGRSQRPTVQQMPSTVEMDTHNFTREDIAEKRMHLLNENGQIDYYLSSSGGPLEIQYLSMLSAHSSYWLSQDFVRFLVIEIGRKRGRANTMEALRAQKRREWKRGEMK